jgi:hypothetical protein
MKKKKKQSWNTFQKLSNIFEKPVYNQGLSLIKKKKTNRKQNKVATVFELLTK